MWSLLLLLGCGDDEPVLSALPSAEQVRAVEAEREAQALKASPAAMEAAYVKAEGVYVDARYLGGRRLTAVRGEVEAQLGALVEERELPVGQGTEMRFQRGNLRVSDDGDIYMIDVPLPEPMRRSDALAALGFPVYLTREYNELTHEYRLTHVWGFRRLRFVRAAPGSEDIARVEAWKRSPTGD